MFSKEEVAEYYNTTQSHYEQWWDLGKSLSLHYGIWEKGITSFRESLANTNRVLMDFAKVSSTDKVLDAGCGVGGAALFLAKEKNVQVTGISLSEKQIAFAQKIALNRNLANKVDFLKMDYTQTSFESETFDVVWACESVSSALDKNLFIQEAFRILKKGGRLVMSDCFLTHSQQTDQHSWIKKWNLTWGVSHLVSLDSFVDGLAKQGFTSVQTLDYTHKVAKTARWMYYAAWLGALPSEIYNLFHPNVSRFGRHHYKSGYFQYKALQENLWKYHLLLAVK
jgi:tocopherol O-methyltransferase